MARRLLYVKFERQIYLVSGSKFWQQSCAWNMPRLVGGFKSFKSHKWVLSSNHIKLATVSRPMKYKLESGLRLCLDIRNGVELDRHLKRGYLGRDSKQILFCGAT